MADFIADGTPLETPSAAAAEGYAATPPSFVAGLTAMAQESSITGPLLRWMQRAPYATGLSGLYGRALETQGEQESGVPLDQRSYDADLHPLPSPMLSAEDANRRYAPTGPDGKPVAITSEPVPEAIAQQVGKAKQDEIEREGVIARFTHAHSGVTNFATGTVAFMLDPLNAASVFIPGVGEEAIAGRLGGGLLARTLGRAVGGATAGILSQAPLTALRYGLGTEEASDYSLRNAFSDMAFAAAGNAVFSAGFGAIGDALHRAIPSPLHPDAASILTADAGTKSDAMHAAVAQLTDGRAIEATPFFYRPPQAETALGRVLGGVRESGDTVGAVAEAQRDLHSTGWSPGMTQEELRAAVADVFPEPKTVAEESVAAPPALSETSGPGETAATPEDKEMTDLEAAVHQRSDLTAEETTELDAASQGVDRADGLAKAFQAAAECIAGGGG